MGSRSAFANLRRLLDAREPKPTERCELCSAPLSDGHQHLLEIAGNRLVCVCDGCALLFSNSDAGRYRRIPRRILFFRDFKIENAEWEALGIPINLAFFCERMVTGKVVALYPGPGGTTESSLDLSSWSGIVDENPALNDMEKDVEGLLVNRVNGAKLHFLAPIDECFRLVGIIRTHWRGLSGGSEAWRELGSYFDNLRQRAIERSARA